MKKTVFHILFAAAIILMQLTGCSVQKNTGMSRAYHNLTARYNVLFNGKESFNKGAATIETNLKDDFSEILPVFPYLSKEAADMAGPDMDRTIKKCTKLISLHSITAKPKVKDSKNLTPKEREFFSKKEYNLYVDDAYLLMGKAHLYKQEYEMASEVFRILINDFKNQPVYFEAQIWYSRLLMQTNQIRNAYEILVSLQNNPEFPGKLWYALYPTLADYHLRQKEYLPSITYLEKALGVEHQKTIRTRYLYMLAQLFEKTGDLKRASDFYARVITMNPVYDMAFNARINRALAYEQGFGQAADIESELIKMLRDDKNTEYQDQIYYALGNLASKEGHDEQAVAYYRQSLAVNSGNEQQKIRSYLTLADFYYAKPDYQHAQVYYDSTVTLIDPDYPGFGALLTKATSLTQLVTELNTVHLSDSLIMLAKLPRQELDIRIDALIAEERKKEELARQQEQEERLDQQFGSEIARQSYMRQQSNTAGTQWYFYNDAAKSMGYREFKLKWGNRKLEDHWQRSSKAVVNFAGIAEESPAEVNEPVAAEPSLSRLSREYYLVNIPKTDSAIRARYEMVEQALYHAGLIYRNELKDLDRAGESFKSLIRRFPSSPFLLASYYNLYGIAREQENPAMADFYKSTLITQFPESMYAKVLSNPDYFKELEAEDRAVRLDYEETYALFKAGNYAEVINRCNHALEAYPDSPLVPQYTYLSTLAKGKGSDRKAFRDNLTALVQQFPDTDVASDAQNLIDYMDKEQPEMKEAEEIILSKKLYQFSPDQPHVFVYVLPRKIDVNQLIFNIINFNLDHFDRLNLRVDRIDLNDTQQLILVKPFPGKEEVMTYSEALRASSTLFNDMPAIEPVPMAISELNLTILKEDKSADRYLKFYKENYP